MLEVRMDGRPWEENMKLVEVEVLGDAEERALVKVLWVKERRGVLVGVLNGRKADLVAMGKRTAPRAPALERVVRNIVC